MAALTSDCVLYLRCVYIFAKQSFGLCCDKKEVSWGKQCGRGSKSGDVQLKHKTANAQNPIATHISLEKCKNAFKWRFLGVIYAPYLPVDWLDFVGLTSQSHSFLHPDLLSPCFSLRSWFLHATFHHSICFLDLNLTQQVSALLFTTWKSTCFLSLTKRMCHHAFLLLIMYGYYCVQTGISELDQLPGVSFSKEKEIHVCVSAYIC